MVNWKEFEIISRKIGNSSTGSIKYELNGTLSFLDGVNENKIIVKREIVDFFKEGLVEIDVDKVKNSHRYSDEVGSDVFRGKENKKKVTVGGKEITVDEYNKLYHNEEHSLLVELSELYDEIYGSKGIGNREEYEKSNKVDKNLFTRIENDYKEYSKSKSFRRIIMTDSQDYINESTKKVEEGMKKVQRLVNEMRVMKANREAYDPDQSYEDKKEQANKVHQLIKQAINEIKQALNKQPQITTEDLDADNRDWMDIENAKHEKIVNDIKSRVLADISAKRVAKQESNKKPLAGQELKNFARDAIREIDTERDKDENTDLYVTWEELEINNPDWRKKITDAAEAGNEKEVRHIKVKVLVDLRFKKAQKKKGEDAWEKVKNGSVGEMNESQLAAAIQNFEKKEGEKGYKRNDEYQSAEDELIKKDPELYKEIVIEALRKRLKNNGLSEEEFSKLNQDYLKLVNKEITEIEEFRRIKNELGVKIGEKGAESKWSSLLNRAKTLLEKAKRKVTQQVKRDLKTIQEQMKNFKSESNSYLNSYYQVNKAKVDNLEKNLSDYSTNQTGSPKKTPWGTIIPVSLVVVFLIGMVAVVIVRRRKQNGIKK